MKPVAFDTTMLSLLLNPNCKIPLDPVTKEPLTFPKERALALIQKLQKERRKVVIPTPASAELLTAIGPDAQQYFEIISRSRVFEVTAFDARCAIELAIMNRELFAKEDKKNKLEPYQKVKFDRQIVAICKSAGCDTIYTDDTGVTKRAKIAGLAVVASWDLGIPESSCQIKMDFEAHEDLPEPSSDDATITE